MTGWRNWKALTATVTTRPRARRAAAMPPAMSTCAITHPPKTSPLPLTSAGIGTTRSIRSWPAGAIGWDGIGAGLAGWQGGRGSAAALE